MSTDPSSCIARFEAHVFGALNGIIEPLVRAGLGSPGLWPSGAIVLETAGRRTGRIFNVPVLATLVGDLAVVATLRRGSQWMRNVAARPDIHYWQGGRRHAATALVLMPGSPAAPPPRVTSLAATELAAALRPWTQIWGVSFAILSPGHPRAA